MPASVSIRVVGVVVVVRACVEWLLLVPREHLHRLPWSRDTHITGGIKACRTGLGI